MPVKEFVNLFISFRHDNDRITHGKPELLYIKRIKKLIDLDLVFSIGFLSPR